MNRLTWCILAAIMLASCANRESSTFHSVGKGGWSYADTCLFDIPKLAYDTISPITSDVAIAIRHSNTYEYSNIWVELTYSAFGSERVDTFNIKLADRFGNWLGCGIGVGYQLTDTVLHNMPLDTVAPIRLRHIMRADTLAGIEQVGIIFERKQQI